jgi:hypothetical protein
MRHAGWMWLLAASAALPLAASDLSGGWSLKGEIAGNVLEVKCSLKQDGDNKLAGTCKTNDMPDSKTTGELKEKVVTFQYDVEYQGQTYTLVYTGTLDTETSVKGTVEAGGASGDFTGTKDESAGNK